MAKPVSVSPLPLNMEQLNFLWTIDNICLLKDCVLETTLFPVGVAKENISQFSACVKLVWKRYSTNGLGFSINLNDQKYISVLKVFIFNTKHEKLKIYESGTLPDGTTNIDDSIANNFFLYEENACVRRDKLIFHFVVDYFIGNKSDEHRSSGGVSLQDSQNDIINGFTQLFKSKQCSDITLNVGDSTVKAHKAVLIARSPVFAAMFKHDMQEQTLNSITITDIDAKVVEEMVRYMYTDTVPNLDAMAMQLLEAADKYEILNLKSKCEESLQHNISNENAAHTLMLADRFNAECLKEETLNYIIIHACDVMETKDWKEMVKIGSNAHLFEAAFRAMALQNNTEKPASSDEEEE